MKTLALITAAGSLAAFAAPAQAADFAPLTTPNITAVTTSATLMMDPPPHARAYGKRAKRGRYYDDDRFDDRRYDRRSIYDDRGRYYEPRRITYRDRVWRARDGRYYCRRDNGTAGLVIGAGVGALAGSELARDRTLGAILGGAAGALIGREIDRGSIRCR